MLSALLFHAFGEIKVNEYGSKASARQLFPSQGYAGISLDPAHEVPPLDSSLSEELSDEMSSIWINEQATASLEDQLEVSPTKANKSTRQQSKQLSIEVASNRKENIYQLKQVKDQGNANRLEDLSSVGEVIEKLKNLWISYSSISAPTLLIIFFAVVGGLLLFMIFFGAFRLLLGLLAWMVFLAFVFFSVYWLWLSFLS